MKANILDSSPTPASREMNYREPIAPPSRPVRHWRMPIVYSLGVLVLLASFVIVGISLRLRADHPSTVQPTPSTPNDGKRWYSLGYVDIEGGVTQLYPVQQGRVARIVARENVPVKTGDPLFYLEDTVPQLNVQRAKAGVEEAQGQLKVAQAEADALDKRIAAQPDAIKAAQIEVERATILRDEKNKLSEDTTGNKFEAKDAKLLLDKAQQAVRGQQAQLATMEILKGKTDGELVRARANLKDKQGLLAEAENAVKECVVRAPVEGMPLRINVNVGETLGANPRQAALVFAAARPLLVRAEVEQELVDRVNPGQKVIIEDSVTEKECASGTVASISRWYAPRRSANPEMVSMNNDNRTLECIVSLENHTGELRIGQRVRVKFPN